MTKKRKDSELTRLPAEQCEKCKQWISPGLSHLCRPDEEDNDNEES